MSRRPHPRRPTGQALARDDVERVVGVVHHLELDVRRPRRRRARADIGPARRRQVVEAHRDRGTVHPDLPTLVAIRRGDGDGRGQRGGRGRRRGRARPGRGRADRIAGDRHEPVVDRLADLGGEALARIGLACAALLAEAARSLPDDAPAVAAAPRAARRISRWPRHRVLPIRGLQRAAIGDVASDLLLNRAIVVDRRQRSSRRSRRSRSPSTRSCGGISRSSSGGSSGSKPLSRSTRRASSTTSSPAAPRFIPTTIACGAHVARPREPGGRHTHRDQVMAQR